MLLRLNKICDLKMVRLEYLEKCAEFFQLLKQVTDKVGELTLESDDLLNIDSAIASLRELVGEEETDGEVIE